MSGPPSARLGLLVVDHGSRLSQSNAQLDDMAARVAALVPAATVRAAHMELARPSIGEALDELVEEGCRDVVVLPYFLSDGRHVREDVPRLVTEAAARHPDLGVRIGSALGPHDDLALLLLNRAGLREEAPTS